MNAPREQLESIWTDWIALWNGDFDRARTIVDDNYKIHMTPVDGSDLSTYAGPDRLTAWIKQRHTLFAPICDQRVQGALADGETVTAGRPR